MPSDLLERIVAETRTIVRARRTARPLADVEREAAARTPRAEAFRTALARPGAINVIAECKRRSPVKGLLCDDYRPAEIARAYEAGGAAAVSVLTEPSFFDGGLDHLAAVRSAVSLPVLRKDFVLDEYQVLEARAAGADAVLLIAAILGDRLDAFLQQAREAGLAALVEVHDAAELDRALAAGAQVVGVNSRDLRTMRVDPETCVRLAARIPPGPIAVAESGIQTAADVARLREAGYAAFLVGERLMRSADPELRLRELTCT